MRKILTAVLIFAFLIFAQSSRAQSRARRVGTNAPAATPSPDSSRPPMPGGTNTTDANRGADEVGQNDVIRVNTTLVTIPVSVMDRYGRYAPNLRQEDFRLWEDGVEQDIAFFASVDKPFSVVLMLDTSPSTRFRLDEIHDAAIAFVNQLHADDRVMVIAFDDDIRVVTDFTSDRRLLQNAIRRTQPGSGTRLYDAVDLVINKKLNQIRGRKAVVLFTDGVDTTSRRGSYESTVRDAEKLDALIYPVAFDTANTNGGGSTWPGSKRPTSPVDILVQILGRGGSKGGAGGGGAGSSGADYERGDRYLHELADKTGGRLYRADSSQNLSNAFANVAEELRRQYSLSYYPKRSAQVGQRRQIRVSVDQPNLTVRARDSYIFNLRGTAAAQTDGEQRPATVLQKKLAQTRSAGNFFTR